MTNRVNMHYCCLKLRLCVEFRLIQFHNTKERELK